MTFSDQTTDANGQRAACRASVKGLIAGLSLASAFYKSDVLDVIADLQVCLLGAGDRPAIEAKVFDRHSPHIVFRVEAGERRGMMGFPVTKISLKITSRTVPRSLSLE